MASQLSSQQLYDRCYMKTILKNPIKPQLRVVRHKGNSVCPESPSKQNRFLILKVKSECEARAHLRILYDIKLFMSGHNIGTRTDTGLQEKGLFTIDPLIIDRSTEMPRTP